jgi:hypothetical protein
VRLFQHTEVSLVQSTSILCIQESTLPPGKGIDTTTQHNQPHHLEEKPFIYTLICAARQGVPPLSHPWASRGMSSGSEARGPPPSKATCRTRKPTRRWNSRRSWNWCHSNGPGSDKDGGELKALRNDALCITCYYRSGGQNNFHWGSHHHHIIMLCFIFIHHYFRYSD